MAEYAKGETLGNSGIEALEELHGIRAVVHLELSHTGCLGASPVSRGLCSREGLLNSLYNPSAKPQNQAEVI